MNEDKDILENAMDLIGTDFAVDIEDNVMRINPAEAGIALFAYIAQVGDAVDSAWESVDVQIAKIEELRADNALLREALDSFRELLEANGHAAAANGIMELLWPIVGILDDGTEIPIVIDWTETEEEG